MGDGTWIGLRIMLGAALRRDCMEYEYSDVTKRLLAIYMRRRFQ